MQTRAELRVTLAASMLWLSCILVSCSSDEGSSTKSDAAIADSAGGASASNDASGADDGSMPAGKVKCYMDYYVCPNFGAICCEKTQLCYKPESEPDYCL
jgi:hypothetical protein